MSIVKETLKNIFNDYDTWKDYKTYYENYSTDVDFTEFLQLPCFTHTDINSINSCSSNTIVIDNGVESIHSSKYFQRYNKDKNYIIFSAGTWDKSKHDIGITSYDIVHTCFWLPEMVDTYFSPHRFCYHLDKQYSFDYPKPYVFCCPIGMVRPQRDVFVNAITNNIEYKNFILRYSGDDFGVPSSHLDVINFPSGDFDSYSVLNEKHYHSVVNTLPIKMYNSCYFNLIVETDLDWQHCFNMSEKTVKVIISGMPFILLSTPFFLNRLQEYGFRTYNTVWDESYDTETDYNKRIEKIILLLKKLEHFDWEANKQELESIANHNLRNLTKLNKISEEIFFTMENVARKYNERRC